MSCIIALPLSVPVVVFLVAFWPRIYLWMEQRDYDFRMAHWQEICPSCGYDVGKPWKYHDCEKCNPGVWDAP